MKLVKCPNCKHLYKLYKSDDPEYNYMMKHDSPNCSYQFVSYQDLHLKCTDEVIKYFKQEFPWKYKDSRKALS